MSHKRKKMKILWLCNNSPINPTRKGGGGWFAEMANEVAAFNYDLVFCFPSKENSGEHITEDKIKYYSFKQGVIDSPSRIKKRMIRFFEEILRNENPDVIHIWGTEFAHSLAMVKAAKTCSLIEKVVVHIQGFCLSCAQNYEKGLPQFAVHGFTAKDLIAGNVHKQKRQFQKRARNELEILRNVKNILGRTKWDYAYSRIINPESSYHHCGELIRKTFYSDTWKLSRCIRHRIFMSQASYPIKGLHIFLDAFKIIVKEYPDTHLVIAGSDLLKTKRGFFNRLRISFYGVYIRHLINRSGVSQSISFTGPLTAEEMKKQYLEANVYVLPSLTENSPNSLGEAMILGLPCVASYVGGIPDFIDDSISGLLYPCDDYLLLAYKTMCVFKSDDYAMQLSEGAKKKAKELFNRNRVVAELLSCYHEIEKRKQIYSDK